MLRQAFQSSVYSTTAQDWRLAGELALGEQVLTHAGSATLTGKRPAPAQRVYNLEVQAVHNFLVADVGVVVHNSCLDELIDLYAKNNKTFKIPAPSRRLTPANPSKHLFEIEEVVNGQVVRIPFSKNGYPDFTNPDWYPGSSFKYFDEALAGDNVGNLDFTPAYNHLKNKFANNPNINISGKSGGAFDIEIDGVKKRYTWHHHEDGKTMIPVLQSIHSKANPHTGGASLLKIENGAYRGLFDSPE